LRSISNIKSTEIIIIDNGSTDKSSEWIKNNYPKIKLLRNSKNLGVTSAWNQGLALSSGDFICIANNDLVFSKNCIEKLTATLQKHSWIGLVSPYTSQDKNRKVPFFSLSAVPYSKKNFKTYKKHHRIGYTGWCFMFRKKDSLNGFDPKYFLWYQDDDFLNQQLFQNRGIPPFRFPAPGKVPIVVSGAEVEHQYSSSHDQLDEQWVNYTTENEKIYFKKKWRGPLGNAYLKTINWGGKVSLNKPEKILLSESQKEIKSNEPLVSSIVPCYNRKELLSNTIKSLINQTYKNHEIIFVDDCSTENLEPFIKNHLKQFNGRWKILGVSYNSGPGIARKIGMENCNGEYIQFIDSDDEPMPNKIYEQVKLLESNQKLLMTYATTIIGKRKDKMAILGKTNKEKHTIYPIFPYEVYWTTSSILWRESYISKHSWFPLFGSEDLLFEFLNGLMDYPIAHTPSDKPLLKKWLHPKNISNDIASDYLYQMEILKCYDIILEKINEQNLFSQKKIIAELYKNKIMFFLVYRRYNEANYCIQMYNKLTDKKFSIEILALSFSKWFSIRQSYRLLRMYYWFIKKVKRKISV
tara:strand:- start:459 stop:2198 length:1740 start_codon:yes stop_codon:yes gene_type:complete